jgi:hypothetical protein
MSDVPLNHLAVHKKDNKIRHNVRYWAVCKILWNLDPAQNQTKPNPTQPNPSLKFYEQIEIEDRLIIERTCSQKETYIFFKTGKY